MTIGETIKRMRRERDITQEALAEYLGVTPQAVSQWENGKTAPDITQLPVLAYLFGVSADTLLCINIDEKEKNIAQTADQARALSQSGNRNAALALLKDGLHTFPDSHRLMHDYALELYCASTSDELRAKNGCTIAGYLDKLLAECTDNRLRNSAITLACSVYPLIGRKEDAVRLADSMENASSRLELLTDVLSGQEKLTVWSNALTGHFHRCFGDMCFFIKQKDEHGQFVFSEEDRLTVIEKVIAAFGLFYEDGDYFYAAQYLEYAYQSGAQIYAARREKQKCIEYVAASAKYATMFDTYDPNAPHTSILVRGKTDGEAWQETHNRSYELLAYYRGDKAFSFVRDEKAFTDVLTMLEQTAK